MDSVLLIILAVVYIGILFLIAALGDKYWGSQLLRKIRPSAYALSIAVYCTSWTFLGSVGYATQTGLAFLAIYIGPALAFIFGMPVFRRIIRLAKAQNTTSVADFIAARYGKNALVAALVAIICIIGVVPYLALQLKAVSSLLTTVVSVGEDGAPIAQRALFSGFDIALIVSLSMAAFAILFGTRHADATEHQEGLVLAVSAESLVKVFALTAVGFFVIFSVFDGPIDFISTVETTSDYQHIFSLGVPMSTFLTILFLSSVCIFLLPRQFHTTVVENRNDHELRRARWLFPFYLVAINLFILPIAVAGMQIAGERFDADLYVLLVPLITGNNFLSVIALVGGISAAIAMVIVAAVALAIMISNDLVFPIWLRQRGRQLEKIDYARGLLYVRRCAIFIVMMLAYGYYSALADSVALASIGLLSFAAIAQLAPAFFIGLIWKGANSKGALTGLLVGIVIWTYTLLLPLLYSSGIVPQSLLSIGPFSVDALNVPSIFGQNVDQLVYGVFWSMAFNIACLVLVSLMTTAKDIDRRQADIFVHFNIDDLLISPSFQQASVTVLTLQNTVARFIGNDRTKRSFEDYASRNNVQIDPKADADSDLMRFTEHLLASAIGASSSRLVLSLLLERREIQAESALQLLDEASEAIQYNRDILQSAINHVQPGIGVFDRDSLMVCWNTSFRDILRLPDRMRRVGTPLKDILQYLGDNDAFDTSDQNQAALERYQRISIEKKYYSDTLFNGDLTVEVSTRKMQTGGFVTTITDVTEKVEVATALSQANEMLEKRVKERTAELEALNKDLDIARRLSDASNASKTRFLAAASHDILQPLNAARLYTSALHERVGEVDGKNLHELAENVDKSLGSVEEILSTLLDISRLDSGALKPEISSASVQDIFDQLSVEFLPVAAEKGLNLTFIPTTLYVKTDPRLFRRLIQNLISNAIKYTPKGRILIGCRRFGDNIKVDVYDTGIGVLADQQTKIFDEFARLEAGAREASGLGLGLSIVQRISRVLNHHVSVRSEIAKGSCFSITAKRVKRIPKARPESVEPTQISHVYGLKILCIDNEDMILNGMSVLLGGWDCDVMTARSLEEALSKLEVARFKPDVAVLDYHLDQGTGLDALVQLRWRFGRGFPAVIVSADRSAQLKKQVRELNVPLLAKPVKPARLKAQLSSIKNRLHVEHAEPAE